MRYTYSMNRPLLITAGITILLTILGVWVYLLFFGAPKQPGEIFTNLGFEQVIQPITITPPTNTSSPTIDALVDTQNGKLRQLTLKPTAGHGVYITGSSSAVRYAEKGTGHIYEINLDTGSETMISRTTVPQTAVAIFSPDATAVAITAYSNYTTNVTVGTIGSGELTSIVLEPGAENITFASNTEVLYTIVRNGVTTGYRHNLTTATRAEVFTFNFGEIDVAWGNGVTGIYVITKPTPSLQSFIYKVDETTLTPVVSAGYGLSALVQNETIVTTKTVDGTYVSEVWNNGTATPLPLLMLKEKCAFTQNNTTQLWCAGGAETPSGTFVDDWYKGLTRHEDYLWRVSTTRQTAELVASPEQLVGQTLDIVNLVPHPTEAQLFFKNRTDQTLWQIDLSI